MRRTTLFEFKSGICGSSNLSFGILSISGLHRRGVNTFDWTLHQSVSKPRNQTDRYGPIRFKGCIPLEAKDEKSDKWEILPRSRISQ